MKKLLITVLLISPFSFAEWGDVYYCETTSHSKTNIEGERTDYKQGRFQFKLDKTKKAMVFGKKGILSMLKMEIIHNMSKPLGERVFAVNKFSNAYLDEGKFMWSMVFIKDIESVTADCEKF